MTLRVGNSFDAGEIGCDCHITRCTVEYRDLGKPYFVVGEQLEARFRINEGEPQPPAGFEVDLVVFGGEYMTVTYTVTKPVAVTGDLFYPNRTQEVFDAYRQSLIDFMAYRAELLTP